MSSFHCNALEVQVKSLYDKLMVFLVGEFVIIFDYTARDDIACLKEMWMD